MKKFFALVCVLLFTACTQPNESVESKTESLTEVTTEDVTDETSETEEITNDQTVETYDATRHLNVTKEPKVKGAFRASTGAKFVEGRPLRDEFPDALFEDGYLYTAEDMNVPVFTLDSEDAKKANEEIERIVASLKEVYTKEIENQTGWVPYAEFSVFENQDLSTVIFTYFDTTSENLRHEPFNFRIADGKRLTDEEIFSYLDLEESGLANLEHSIGAEAKKSYFLDMYNGGPINEAPLLSAGNLLESLWDRQGDYHIFFSPDGEARYLYEQKGAFKQNVLLIEALPLMPERKISPAYTTLTQLWNIDPDGQEALIMYLGAMHDDETTVAVIEKINAYKNLADAQYSPKFLIRTEYDDVGQPINVQPKEVYLLVPKYAYQTVKMKALVMNEAGDMEPVDNEQLDNQNTFGTTVLLQNTSELHPDAEITMRFRENIETFSPSLSMKDGEMSIPETLYDTTKELNTSMNDVDKASHTSDVFDYLRTFLP